MNVNTKTKVPWKFDGLETLCGLQVKKATKIVTLPIDVKVGFMHALLDTYTHNTLPLGYETLEYECRH